MILNKEEILERINCEKPIIKNIKNIDIQIQPTGLDLTINKIYKFIDSGILDFDNSERKISKKEEIFFNIDKWYLRSGCYSIKFNEIFNFTNDIIGITISRSSLQRCGVSIYNGFFEAGFIGDGYCLLNILNPNGLYIKKDARICQIIFEKINKTILYNGIYQNLIVR